jgi:hypothetical protein
MEKSKNPTKQHSMKCPKLYGKKCTCDGYHTFDELYEHRITLFIALCRMYFRYYWQVVECSAEDGAYDDVWRSKLHSDGSSYKGWFILGINQDKGKQITYHLPIKKWKETNFAKTLEKAPKFDGHTPEKVLKRLKNLI